MYNIFIVGFLLSFVFWYIVEHDTIAQAPSGSGKTEAYLIPSLELLDLDNINKQCFCQVLILAPTRELATQIYSVCKHLSAYMTNVICYLCVGGTNVRKDIRELQRANQQIIIGMPGRITDMVNRGALRLHKLQLFVLDEADCLLSNLFKEQIYDCFQFLPTDVQVVLMGTTFPDDVLQLTKKFMRNPINIFVNEELLIPDVIHHYRCNISEEKYRFDTLVELYETLHFTQAIIFVNSKKTANWLSDKMKQEEFIVSTYHGDMRQEQRNKIMKEFRSLGGTTRAIIATDVMVCHVFFCKLSLHEY